MTLTNLIVQDIETTFKSLNLSKLKIYLYLIYLCLSIILTKVKSDPLLYKWIQF